MTNVATLDTPELESARNYCKQNWGWSNPPQEILNRAIITLRFKAANARVGDIILQLNLMPATKIDKLAKEKKDAKSATPLIDYIIENDSESKDFPEYKSTILAYRHEMMYFDNLDIDGLRIHPDMNSPQILEVARKFKAALYLIEGSTPVLVFAGFDETYQNYNTEGKAEQLRNIFKTNYPDLKIAAGNSSQILAVLDEDALLLSGSEGSELRHIELVNSESSAHRKLSQIHDFVIRLGGTDYHIEPMHHLSDVPVFGRFDTVLKKLDKKYWFSAEEYQQIKLFLTAKSGAVQNNAVLQKPADGRYTYKMNDKSVDVRCSFIPTGMGTTLTNNMIYIRCRILTQTIGAIDLKKFGLSDIAIKHMIRAVRAESGMSIMVGPTGSGKSTTLFGMVNEHYKIHGETKSRVSVEDPVERKVPNVSQIQLTEAIKSEDGNPFLAYLKHLLRFDPDFLVVGEMRDAETVEAGGNYANTGHIVLGTLHANNTIIAIERIINMLKDDNMRRMIIDSTHYIFSQRLIPILCPECKTIGHINDELYNDLVSHVKRSGNDDSLIPREAAFQSENGCKNCGYSGVISKKPVNEVLELTDEVKHIVFSNDPDKTVKLRPHRAITVFDETLQLINEKSASIKELFK